MTKKEEYYKGYLIHESTHGYKCIFIKCKQHLVHRMIWEEANGPIPKGMCIHHINEDKTDNTIENLICLSIGEHTSLHTKGIKHTKKHNVNFAKSRSKYLYTIYNLKTGYVYGLNKIMMHYNKYKNINMVTIARKFVRKNKDALFIDNGGIYDGLFIKRIEVK